MKYITFEISNDQYNKIKMISSTLGISVSDFMKQVFNQSGFNTALDLMWTAFYNTSVNKTLKNEEQKRGFFLTEIERLSNLNN